MPEKYLYFQPEYVREFICDGRACRSNCCEKNWGIDIDANTYAQYERIRPESKARELTSHFIYDADSGKYLLKERPCPFLTDKKLCRLQLEYGENFLSAVCRTYPRQTRGIGKMFFRAMSLTCSIAAEMILFRDEPLTFELVELSEDSGVKNSIIFLPPVPQKLIPHFVDVQIEMISILQKRTLTIDQRLIVLGFFLDRLDEIISDNCETDAPTKLIAAYKSKNFWAQQIPLMLATIRFDAKNFVSMFVEILKIFPDATQNISATIAVDYEKLADERKKFLARYSTFLENFLVNELFLICYPWRYEASIAKNFGLFVAQYKLFELLIFSAVKNNLDDRNCLLSLTERFTNKTDHSGRVARKLLELVPDDIFSLTEMLLKP